MAHTPGLKITESDILTRIIYQGGPSPRHQGVRQRRERQGRAMSGTLSVKLSDDSLMVLSGIKQQHLVMINCGCANHYTTTPLKVTVEIRLYIIVDTRLYVIVVTRLYVIVVTPLQKSANGIPLNTIEYH